MVRRTTRRNKASKKYMTIPEIKTAFEIVQRGAYDIIKEGGSSAEQVKKFQKVWKSVFHRPVSSSAAEAYLKFKKTQNEKRPAVNRTRKHKGGAMPLAGAPLDYSVRPGVDTVYGSFPEYQSAGLKFYDTVNQVGMSQECGIKDITPHIGGQSGGTFSDAIHQSPAPVSTPPSIINNLQQGLSGRSPSSSPVPYQN